MDNTIEKLIELLEECDNKCQNMPCDECEYVKSDECNRMMELDHLIANGVTFATDNNVGDKWIPVTERLPEDWVLCACVDGVVHILCYDYIMDDWDIWGRPNTCYSKRFVTHWMPLPEPPKGDV